MANRPSGLTVIKFAAVSRLWASLIRGWTSRQVLSVWHSDEASNILQSHLSVRDISLYKVRIFPKRKSLTKYRCLNTYTSSGFAHYNIHCVAIRSVRTSWFWKLTAITDLQIGHFILITPIVVSGLASNNLLFLQNGQATCTSCIFFASRKRPAKGKSQTDHYILYYPLHFYPWPNPNVAIIHYIEHLFFCQLL